MPRKILPKLFKIGEYEIDKINFFLYHKNQVKGSSGRKRCIEYKCDKCDKIYITKLRDEIKKEFPWICRSCRTKIYWQDEKYKNKIMSGITEETRKIRRRQCQLMSRKFWDNPIKHAQHCQMLRNRDPSVYSKGKRKCKQTTIIKHWLTDDELICTASYEIAFVHWCNLNKIDFDWQIAHKMPDQRTYIIDAYIKSGQYKNTWIEIKGHMTKIGKEKWDWFHSIHPNNSQLWNKDKLVEMKILK